MQGDDPPFLPVGTDVSAKYKGAFCEAKVKKVVRNIKCKVTLKVGGSTTVNDDFIKGVLRVGSTVEVKQDPKKDAVEAVITKIQDCSQYTVVFDDGDITTLRRSALCLKSGRHFNESETLDQLPLTHPEHFSTPVIAGRRGRRGRAQSDDSDGEVPVRPAKADSAEREPHVGRVVLVDTASGTERRRPQAPPFPALVVAPKEQIKVKEDYLVRSFKDGRFYTVPKKETREFRKGNAPADWAGVDAALQYLNNGVLPPHWDRDSLFNEPRNSSDDSSDDEPREEKDHFVAQLYKFMDDRGTPLNRNPTIANRDIDLYRLFRVVQKSGGYNRVTNQNQWKTVAEKMGFQTTTSITNLCKQAYKKFLHSFEDFYRKLGVTLVAHPRGARTPPAGRSLIRDRDKQPPSSTTPTPTTQRGKSDKDSDKSEADKSEKEDVKVEPKVEKVKEKEKDKETVKEKEKPRASDGEDSADNQPLLVATPKVEKEKEKVVTEDKIAVKTQKVRPATVVKTDSQDKRTPKPRKALSSKSVQGDSAGASTSRASRRPHVSTDSDSSGRASRNLFRSGITKKMQSRRSQSANSASSGNTIASNSSKRVRKRKITEPSPNEPSTSAGPIKAVVGDKLQVYYGPTQSESKVTYEAKVIEISSEGMLRVHYTGWNTRYDEWIKPQRIAVNVTQHERSHGKKSALCSRRVRTKRAEESSTRSDSTDSDSEVDIKRMCKKSEEKTPLSRSIKPSSTITSKDMKPNDGNNDSMKIRKRPIRSVTTPTAASPPKRPRSVIDQAGREFDMNEIRSELKGLQTVKQEPEDEMAEIADKDIPLPDAPEPPKPEKQAEDVYEFKEPEPFELELHDEKKKRTHRIFDEISPSKYSSTLSKSLSEEISEDLRPRPSLRSPSLSPFRDFSARDAAGTQSPEDDSKDGMFSLDDDSLPGDGSSGPIFEGFIPAKNQETYSKKNKLSKLIDDSPDSPADDERSSEDESEDLPVKEVIEREVVEPKSEVRSSELRKSPETFKEVNKEEDKKLEPVPEVVQEVVVKKVVSKEEQKEERNIKSKSPPPLAVIVETVDEPKLIVIPSAICLPPIDIKVVETTITPIQKSPKIVMPPSPVIDTEEEKSEPDSPSGLLAVIQEPPPGFLLQSEGPRIADKLLKAIDNAKEMSLSPPPIEEPPLSPKEEVTLVFEKPTIDVSLKVETKKPEAETKESIFSDQPKESDTKGDGEVKKAKVVTEVVPPKTQNPSDVLAPNKSGPDLPLAIASMANKTNKVLNDTIQKLSSQINQSVSNIPLPSFPPEDASDSSDSDDSNRRLIIDKLSVDEWNSGGSSEASRTARAGPHATKSPGEWSAGESLLMLEDACKNERKHSASVVVAGNMRVEEDSNISLLLCEETIPGSPAPDSDPAPPRHRLHMPFASAPPHHDTRKDERRGDTSNPGGHGNPGNSGHNPGTREGARRATLGWGRRNTENSPPSSPASSTEMSPRRERRISERNMNVRKNDEDEVRSREPSLMDMDKPNVNSRSRKASESSCVGGINGGNPGVSQPAARGRPRRVRRDTDDPQVAHAPLSMLRYNFFVEMDPSWDRQTRINILSSKLSDIRKAYLNVKAELAMIDRRRKKLRRKEREAVKAAKAACS